MLVLLRSDTLASTYCFMVTAQVTMLQDWGKTILINEVNMVGSGAGPNLHQPSDHSSITQFTWHSTAIMLFQHPPSLTLHE